MFCAGPIPFFLDRLKIENLFACKNSRYELFYHQNHQQVSKSFGKMWKLTNFWLDFNEQLIDVRKHIFGAK